MSKFTVDINGARGAFDKIEEAKNEAIALARMNEPDRVTIEDEQGFPIFYFFVAGRKLKMTEISYSTVEVDNDS